MWRLTLVYFLFFQLCFLNAAFAQTYTPSKIEKTINGKKFYIHKVEKSQSLYGIAKLYSVDLNALIIENPEAIDGIKTHQELKIPIEKPKQAIVTVADFEKYITHNVVKGETVYSICYKYQITNEQLLTLNPDVRNGLKDGAVLKIKEKSKTVTTNTVTTQTTTVQTNTTIAVVIPNDSLPAIAINKPKKTSYNVGVFLPFLLKESELLNIDELIVNKQNFPPSQQLAIDFYEGLQRAADSLKSSDFSVNFKIYDVGEKDSFSVLKYVKDENFKNLDLIIGPLYNSSFKIISTEAKKLQIPCISPLTQQNKVLFDNAFTSKTTPSNSNLLQGLANFCLDSLYSQNLVLINSGVSKDQANIKSFKRDYNEKLILKNLNDTLPEVRGINGAKSLYKADKLNYYVVLTENEVFVSDFVTHLNMFADKKENIRVIGLRKWLTLDNLDLEYLNRFGFIFPAAYFIDNDDAFIKKINTWYRQKYYTDAGDYYYYAAETGLYYFNLLKTTGPSFCIVLDDFPKNGNVINFDFFHPNNTTGFENRAVQIIRYNDYKLKKAN